MLYKKCSKCSEIKPLEDFYDLKDKKQSYCKECCKSHNNKKYNKKVKKEEQTVTLFFTDTHYPHLHGGNGHLEFLRDVAEKWGANRFICGGDLMDFHRASRFLSEVSSLNVEEEYKLALSQVEELCEVFPDVTLLESNHDSIPARRVKEMGLTPEFLKDKHDLLGLPDTWDIQDKVIENGVIYSHGKETGGINGARLLAQRNGQSSAIGHLHSFGGCQYLQTPTQKIFGLNAGCLVETDSLYMEYGKNSKYQPTLGCAIVISSEEAYFIPFNPKDYK